MVYVEHAVQVLVEAGGLLESLFEQPVNWKPGIHYEVCLEGGHAKVCDREFSAGDVVSAVHRQ